MQHLAYIPNQKDKKDLNILIKESQKWTSAPQEEDNCSQNKSLTPARELSKSQLDALLNRLTKITKKEYDIQQQTAHILHQNKQLHQKRARGEKVENRLLAKGKEKDKKIIEMAQKLQKERKETVYREIPEISEKGLKVIQKSIDRRLDELISNRQNKKAELCKKYEPSFQPAIDSHSEFINDIENLGDLFNRMSTKQKEAEKRKSTFLKKIKQEQKEQLTFKPKIDEKSRDIAQNLPPRPLSSPYEHSPSVQASQVFPFAPTINKNTDQLLKNREKNESCFKRLYNQARQLTQKNQEKAEERDKARSFQPSLNDKSRKMANSLRERHKMLKEKGESCESMVDKQDQFFQEVKIGRQPQFSRGRTYSLRGSKITKEPWVSEPDSHSFKNLKRSIWCKMNLMK